MALPNDHPSNKKNQPREKIEGRELANFAERFDPVPQAVVDAARDAFRTRQLRHHPEAQRVPIDSDEAREAATNNDMS